MPRFVRLGNHLVNVDQIARVHAEEKDGKITQVRITSSDGDRDGLHFTGEQADVVYKFLLTQTNPMSQPLPVNTPPPPKAGGRVITG